MGIPAFFRWLIDKYNGLIQETTEPREPDGSRSVVDFTEMNPNGEYDNLYLDMNGIIHPCAHPEKGPKPHSVDDMIQSIYEYLDLLFAIIRPRKLIYMAVDGVAPRAKMNQQRTRRFRAALDSRLEKDKEEKEWRDKIFDGLKTQEEYDQHLEEKQKKFKFDSNCITPGTLFMDRVAESLRTYVAEKITTDPAWKDVKIIISDASVPGEGEHKIMDYIRHQRAQPDYDPNLKHIIYGLDADLIMLGLATHEVNFDILREFIQPIGRGVCHKCHKKGHLAINCTEEEANSDVKDFLVKNYQILHLHLLKEYLELETRVSTPFGFNIDRVVDDFIFLCFFVGNDFLPHLPNLEIKDGAIDRVLKVYKDLLPSFDDYLVTDGEVNFIRLSQIFAALTKTEEESFRRKVQKEEQMLKKKNKFTDLTATPQSLNLNGQTTVSHKEAADKLLNELLKPIENEADEDNDDNRPNKKLKSGLDTSASVKSNKKAAELIKNKLVSKPSSSKLEQDDTSAKSKGKRKLQQIELDEEQQEQLNIIAADQEKKLNKKKLKQQKKQQEEDEIEQKEHDENNEKAVSLFVNSLDEGRLPTEKEIFFDNGRNIKYAEEGWRDRYYKSCFDVDTEEGIKEICKSYVEGLVWVLKYYFKGCSSWGWYYPYHYSPYITDISKFFDEFEYPTYNMGEPFKPFNQLMSVLPPASSQFVPKPYQKLMGLSVDGSPIEESPIIQFYPRAFRIDRGPSEPLYKGVCLLPFIDAPLLLETIASRERLLTEEETDRNTLGHDLLFCHKDSLINQAFLKEKKQVPIPTTDPSKIFGTVESLSKLSQKKMPPLMDAVGFKFNNPQVPNGYKFIYQTLKGSKIPKKSITTLNRARTQNAAMNRMINNSMGGSNQYKDNSQFNGGFGQYQQFNNITKYNNNQNNNYNNYNNFGYNNTGNQYNNNNNNNNQNYNNNYNNNQNYNNNYNNNQNYNNNFNNQQNYNQNYNNYNNNNNNNNNQNYNGYNQNYNNNNNYNNQNFNNGQNYNNNNFNNQNYNQNNFNNNNQNLNNYNNQNFNNYNQNYQQQQQQQQNNYGYGGDIQEDLGVSYDNQQQQPQQQQNFNNNRNQNNRNQNNRNQNSFNQQNKYYNNQNNSNRNNQQSQQQNKYYNQNNANRNNQQSQQPQQPQQQQQPQQPQPQPQQPVKVPMKYNPFAKSK